MKIPTFLNGAMAVLAFALGGLLPVSAAAQTTPSVWESGKWRFAGTLYLYLPSLGGKTTFPVDSGGSGISVDAGTIIDNLKMTFMGSLGAHNGRWGVFTDVLYLDVGGSKSQTRDFSFGGVGLPASTTADLDFDLKGTIWTLGGEYRVLSDPAWRVDLLAGARLFDVKPKLRWSISGDLGPIAGPGRSGSKQVGDSVWDGIVGVKGRYAFGSNHEWFVPFYLDVGTGQSDLTWQGAVGVGYAFRWGDLLAGWRYLDYSFKSGRNIEDVNFNGPMFGATFRW